MVELGKRTKLPQSNFHAGDLVKSSVVRDCDYTHPYLTVIEFEYQNWDGEPELMLICNEPSRGMVEIFVSTVRRNCNVSERPDRAG